MTNKNIPVNPDENFAMRCIGDMFNEGYQPSAIEESGCAGAPGHVPETVVSPESVPAPFPNVGAQPIGESEEEMSPLDCIQRYYEQRRD